jgi:hypothetical protein
MKKIIALVSVVTLLSLNVFAAEVVPSCADLSANKQVKTSDTTQTGEVTNGTTAQ